MRVGMGVRVCVSVSVRERDIVSVRGGGEGIEGNAAKALARSPSCEGCPTHSRHAPARTRMASVRLTVDWGGGGGQRQGGAVCVRACMRVCVCACVHVCVYACVCACVKKTARTCGEEGRGEKEMQRRLARGWGRGGGWDRGRGRFPMARFKAVHSEPSRN